MSSNSTNQSGLIKPLSRTSALRCKKDFCGNIEDLCKLIEECLNPEDASLSLTYATVKENPRTCVITFNPANVVGSLIGLTMEKLNWNEAVYLRIEILTKDKKPLSWIDSFRVWRWHKRGMYGQADSDMDGPEVSYVTHSEEECSGWMFRVMTELVYTCMIHKLEIEAVKGNTQVTQAMVNVFKLLRKKPSLELLGTHHAMYAIKILGYKPREFACVLFPYEMTVAPTEK